MTKLKDLGVYFNSKLLFAVHINYVSNKTNSFLFHTSHKIRSINSVRKLHRAYDSSKICLGSTNIIFTSIILQNIHNRFTSYISKKMNNNSFDNPYVINELKFTSLPDSHQLCDIKFICKIVNSQSDSSSILSKSNFNAVVACQSKQGVLTSSFF